MNCNINKMSLNKMSLNKMRLVSAAFALFVLTGSSAAAQPVPAVLQVVHAFPGKEATTVALTLAGTTMPTLHAEGNRLVVTLPHTSPAMTLKDHLTSDGLVSGIDLEQTEPDGCERVFLVLRSPAEGRLLAGPNTHIVRVIVAPEGRLKDLSRAPSVSAKSTPRLVVATPRLVVATPRLVVATPRLVVATPRLAAAYAAETPVGSAHNDVLTPAVSLPRTRLYNINAYQSDLVGVLNSLAQDSHVSIVMVGAVSSKVTMRLRQVPLEKAVDLLTKSAGLGYHRDGDVLMIGSAKDLAAAYPSSDAAVTQIVYRCLHVAATDVVTALLNTFDKDKLRVSLGAAPSSPHLDDATASSGTGTQGTTMKNTDAATGGAGSHLIVLSGEEGTVAQALDLARKLDVRRAQVKIGVQITDINRSSLKNLGLQWSFGSLGIHESQPNGIGFGSFTRDPLSVSATITALENSGNAKLLAAPNMSILDGERGFILIGDRIQFPKLTGYTQAQTPIYDVTEERVGIYLQVAVQMEDNGELTLTIYPQISTVSGYLNVNGASYPQISTREQQTTIRVKDGQQIVVGGLIRDEEINNVQRVPLLSQIPLFKELFTYRNTTHQQSEVVIVITPQILKD